MVIGSVQESTVQTKEMLDLASYLYSKAKGSSRKKQRIREIEIIL